MSFLVNPYWFGGLCTDADALAFLTAAGITDATITAAICTLVTSMKANGTWAKCSAIYPFVGNTASQQKWNLKNPADTNGAFRLLFSGGWTHSSNGAQPNGTNAYADTFLNPSTVLVNSDNVHLSNYSRTQDSSANGVQMGCYDGVVNDFNIFQYFAAVSIKGGNLYFYPTQTVSINNTNTKGFQITTRTGINVAKLHFNGSLLATNTTTRTTVLPANLTITIGAANRITGIPVQYSPHELAFISIGAGLTDAEAATFYTDVQAFQTTLGRNV
jgi:hypothetical protein